MAPSGYLDNLRLREKNEDIFAAAMSCWTRKHIRMYIDKYFNENNIHPHLRGQQYGPIEFAKTGLGVARHKKFVADELNNGQLVQIPKKPVKKER